MGSIYDATVAYLESQKVTVSHDAEGFASFEVDVAPLAWRVHVWVREDASQVLVHSLFPTQVPAERCTEMALFTTRANFGLSIGNFELDLDAGELRYKTSIDFGGDPVSDAMLRPVFVANISTMGRYLPGIQAVLVGADAAACIAAIETA